MTSSPSADLASETAPFALFSVGLRPFFLGAALWATLAMFLWIPVWMGVFELPTLFDPMAWHVHEMLFGYAGAAAAGFLLTAVPSWTGATSVKGGALLGLFALWLVARLAVLTSALTGPWLALIADATFFGFLAAWTARAVITAGNKRNLAVAGLILTMGLAAVLHHLEPLGVEGMAETAFRLGIGAFVLLVGLIGGRVVPNFTRNWLKQKGVTPLPPEFGPVDKLALVLLLAAMVLWVVLPGQMVTGLVALAAAVAHGVRLSRWNTMGVRGEPMLWVLHLGYAWLPVGLGLIALDGLAIVSADIAAIHALSVGAFGTLILGIMARASRGHTGRPVSAGWVTLVLFLLVTAAAVLRVIYSFWPEIGMAGLHGAAGLWMLAHLGFLLRYGPMLIRPRVS